MSRNIMAGQITVLDTVVMVEVRAEEEKWRVMRETRERMDGSNEAARMKTETAITRARGLSRIFMERWILR